MVTRILAAFKSKNTPAITPDQLITKSQRINEIMRLPEVQKLKNEERRKKTENALQVLGGGPVTGPAPYGPLMEFMQSLCSPWGLERGRAGTA